MKLFYIFLIMLITVFRPYVLPAGYKDLVDEFNNYTPPDDIVTQNFISEGSHQSTEIQPLNSEKEIKQSWQSFQSFSIHIHGIVDWVKFNIPSAH